MDSVRLLTLVLFLVYAATGASSPINSIYLESLNANYSIISAILTTYAVVAMLGSFFWGKVSDRIGRRKPLVVGGLFGMSIAVALIAIAPDYRFAWGIRVFEALAMSAYGTTSLAFVGDLLETDKNRGRRIGSYRGFGSLSFALGSFGAKFVIDGLGLPQVYMMGSLFFFLAGLIALTIREAEPAPRPVQPEATAAAPRRRWFQSPISLLFLLGAALWGGAHSAQASMFANFLVHVGYEKSTASWLWGIAALSEAPFMIGAGMLADVIGRMPVLILGGVGLGTVMAGYIFVYRWLPALIGVQLVRGFGYSSFTATSMTYAAETGTARSRAGTVGTYNMAMGMGSIVGLAVGGQVVQFLGFDALFWLCMAAYLSSSVIFWIMGRQPAERERRRQQTV